MDAFNPALKLTLVPERLVAFKRDDWSQPPVMVEIAPTNHCNAACDWCFYVKPMPGSAKQRHSRDELEWPVLKGALLGMADMGVKAASWTGGGDPSVYSAIDEAVSLAHSLGLEQGMFTNAYAPIARPELLKWIRITVTEKFIITKHVAAYASKTKVGVNFNLCRQNESRLRETVVAAKQAGVAYFQVRPALADTVEQQEPVEYPAWLKDYESQTFKVILTPYKFADYLEPHGYPHCYGHILTPFVWYDGNVDVCAYHKRTPGYTFGNLREQSFREIWLGEKRRAMLAEKVKVIPKCQHCCKAHEINKVLAAVAGEHRIVEDEVFL